MAAAPAEAGEVPAGSEEAGGVVGQHLRVAASPAEAKEVPAGSEEAGGR